MTHEIQPGDCHQTQSTSFIPFSRQGSNRYCTPAKEMRDQLCSYMNSRDGEVSWQWNMI